MNVNRVHLQGRRPATDHAAIERAAFDLFEKQGFDMTTMAEIADAVGVGRRTLFRYFPSKNDIPWGQFDKGLENFRAELESVPANVHLSEAVHRCVVAFNDFDEDALPQHRLRMHLILTTPTLQAHSALRYRSWRRVIVEFVAQRTGLKSSDLLPNLVGHISLALAITAYEQWLREPSAELAELLDTGMSELRSYLCP